MHLFIIVKMVIAVPARALERVKHMKLKDLLQGKTDKAQQALDAFFSGIDEEKILWYPSAGKDYRDLMEVTPERLALHGIPEQPTIICHTDYNPSSKRWASSRSFIPTSRVTA